MLRYVNAICLFIGKTFSLLNSLLFFTHLGAGKINTEGFLSRLGKIKGTE